MAAVTRGGRALARVSPKMMVRPMSSLPAPLSPSLSLSSWGCMIGQTVAVSPMRVSPNSSSIRALSQNTFTTASSSESDNNTSESSSAPSSKPRCDPYGQGGKPLSTEEVEEAIKLHLKPGWNYDTNARILSKQYKFVTSSNRPCSTSAYSFMSRLCASCVHHGHAPYSAELQGKQGIVNIKLRTPQLHGISWEDFTLALKLDHQRIDV